MLKLVDVSFQISAIQNLALQQTVWESSTQYDGVPSRAVDGNTKTIYSGLSCSHTAAGDTDPWFVVDLGRWFIVQGVILYNRADCCGEFSRHDLTLNLSTTKLLIANSDGVIVGI